MSSVGITELILLLILGWYLVMMRGSQHVILVARGPLAFLLEHFDLVKVHLELLLIPGLIVLLSLS